jgi:hypothetical protein
MASKWWQTSDADLDYGFDSDELDTRYDSDRNAHPYDTTETRKPEDTEEKGLIGNMASWFQRQAGSSEGQLATTAVISGAAVASAIFGYQSYKRKEAVHDLKASIPNIDDSHPAGKVSCITEAAHTMPSRLYDREANSLAHFFRSRRNWCPAKQRR